VSAYRRVGVREMYRRIGVSAYRRVSGNDEKFMQAAKHFDI
jgi:hypothetical protein